MEHMNENSILTHSCHIFTLGMQYSAVTAQQGCGTEMVTFNLTVSHTFSHPLG